MAFVHLQTHSEFSVLQSSARLKEIFKAAAADNAPAVALTDHGTMFGILEFQEQGKSFNKGRIKEGLPPVKTVLGCHIYVDSTGGTTTDPSSYERLTLLVENKEGYYNLLRIVSYRYEESSRWQEIPYVPLSEIEKYKTGLIAIAGDFFSAYGSNVLAGRNAAAKTFISDVAKIFDNEHLYLSVADNGIIQQNLLNEFTKNLAKELSLQLVAVGDVHYIKREDAPAHKVLRCIALKEKRDEYTDKRFPTDEFYFRTEAEMQKLLGQYENAIENTVKIAERCNFEVITGIGDDFWPRFEIPKDFLASEEYQKIKAIIQNEYENEYVGFYEKEMVAYCKKNEKQEENLDDEDKKAIEKNVAKVCKHGSDSDIYITHLCNEKLKWRFPTMDFKFPNRELPTKEECEVAERLYTELNCIRNMNVAGYLLIVWDFINWARENNIPVGPGRGSAAGSLVTYITGITDINPLRFGLLFERFLNPERVSMPDIDTDFADRDRDKVINFVTEKYGYDCVGQIITYGLLKSKAVIKDVIRVLGYEAKEKHAESIIEKFPQRLLNFTLTEAETGKDKKKGEPLPDYNPAPLQELLESNAGYREAFEIAKKLEDLPRQTGVHACGVVITPTPIYNLAPLYRAAPEDTPVVMYDKHYSETIGLLKMDFLGLVNLSIIQDTVDMVKKTRHIEVNMSQIPLDDKKTFELFGKGMTTTVFQFESPGMQKYMRELQPEKIEDLIAMNALYRPGPLDQIPHFIARKKGLEPIDYYHEDLKDILGETYGVIVYQEQVMKLAQVLGGYTLGGADNIRRVMAKKMPEKMEKLEPEFKERCVSRGYDAEMINKIWDAVLPFCGYAFNKSHAAAYAYVAYQTAYLKTHFGPEYMAASMTSKMGGKDEVVIMILECKRMGIEVLSPDINHSAGVFFANEKHQIVFGLAGIKGVGLAVAEDIVAERERNGKYKDLFDFIKRVADYQASLKVKRPPINKGVLEKLITAGALDSLPGTRAALFATIQKVLDKVAKQQESKSIGQISLFDLGGEQTLEDDSEVLEEAVDWEIMDMLKKEKEVIGMFLSGHPLDEYRPEIQGFTTCSLALEELRPKIGRTVCVAGVVTKIRSIETRRGDTIGVGEIQDFQGEMEFFLNKDNWERFRDVCSQGDRILVKGSLEYKRDRDKNLTTEPQIIVEDAYKLDEVRAKLVNYVHFSILSDMLTESFFEKLTNGKDQFGAFFGEHPSKLVAHIEMRSGHEHALILNNCNLVYSPELLKWLKQDIGALKVWVSGKPRK